MALFGDMYTNTTVTTPETSFSTPVQATTNVDLLFAANPVDVRRVIRTCCTLIAQSGDVANPEQFCAYHLSIILNFFPTLELTIISELRQINRVAVKRVMPLAQIDIGIELEADYDPNEFLIIVAQAIYLMYKNVNPVRYNITMRNMINALKDKLGVDCRTEDLQAFKYEHAHVIRAMCGSCLSLKADVINQLINNRVGHGQLSIMCDYMCCVLAWTDMENLVFISNELLATKSPIIIDARVFWEVRNLARAFSLINGTEYPQYFSIRKPGIQTRFLESSKFPTLVAVAERLRRERLGNHIQLVPTMSVTNEFVTELLNIHKAGTGGGSPLL